jgi:hypothetical protein
MQPVRLLIGGLAIVAGATFTGQGLGILRGSSFMVDDPRWAVIGLVLVAGGAAVAWSGRPRAERS